jgi:farnesyl-diphosphate farnesyltransferase
VSTSIESHRRSIVELSDAEIQDLLVQTSRTFALCIPMLPPRLRRQVGISYLLFRIADTIEDGNLIAREEKTALLGSYGRVLASAQSRSTSWFFQAERFQRHRPSDHPADAALFTQTARVIATAIESDPAAVDVLLSNVGKSVDGMRKFVSAGSEAGDVVLKSKSELTDYCYRVAGLVGEMLTELFLMHDPVLQSVADELGSRARCFGEALQLVNILKDSAQDHLEGRHFIPVGVSRDAVIAMAQEDLAVAQQYVDLLRGHGADQGIVRFTQFPVHLASLTLDQVIADGPGAKVGREVVSRLLTPSGSETIDARQDLDGDREHS